MSSFTNNTFRTLTLQVFILSTKAIFSSLAAQSLKEVSLMRSKEMKVLIGLCSFVSGLAFQSSSPRTPTLHALRTSTPPLHMNFFKELISGAFENDSNLSQDKSLDQLEGPNDNDDNKIQSYNLKTDVQKKWLESQARRPVIAKSGGTGKGAPMNPDLLPNTKWTLSLYLTGVPNFDPSSSLYGSKVNISSRRDSTLARDGFAIGADVLPEESSVQFEITLLEGGKCQVTESAFTTSDMGEWKLGDDGRMIRFSFTCTGYQRKVTTKGSIQNISWSDRENAERSTSATYDIASGQVFAEARIGFGSKPGLFVMAQMEGNTDSGAPGGLLKVEKAQGMFGVTSKMMACGKFSAQMAEIE